MFLEFGKKGTLDLEGLRSDLAKEGVFLPAIEYKYNPELPSSSFSISYSFHFEEHDLSKLDDVLSRVAREYNLPIKDTEDIRSLIEEGNNVLARTGAGKYTAALEIYDKAYYWILVADVDKLQTELVNTICNIIYIYYTNGKLPDNILQLADNLLAYAEGDKFHDPVLRYHVHFMYANLLWLQENYDEALEYWNKCVTDVERVDEPEIVAGLTMVALHSIVNAYSVLDKDIDQDYITTLKIMREIVPSDAQKNMIADVLLAIANRQIKELVKANQRLAAQNAEWDQGLIDMIQSESKSIKDGLFWNKALTIAHGLLVVVAPFFTGAKSPLIQFAYKLIEVTHNRFSGNSSVFRIDRG